MTELEKAQAQINSVDYLEGFYVGFRRDLLNEHLKQAFHEQLQNNSKYWWEFWK